MTDRETIARALVDVTNRWIKPNFPEGHKLRGFDELDEQEQRLNLDYADAALSVMQAASHAQHPRPYPVRLYAWGGQTRVNDYLMSDGSVKAMALDEAKASGYGAAPRTPAETDWQIMYEAETRISAKQAAEIVHLREELSQARDQVEEVDAWLAKAADQLNITPIMRAMDLGNEITQWRFARQKHSSTMREGE